MINVSNMFRAFSMKHIKGFKALSSYQKDLFDSTYKKHIFSLNKKNRSFYTESHIKKLREIEI